MNEPYIIYVHIYTSSLLQLHVIKQLQCNSSVTTRDLGTLISKGMRSVKYIPSAHDHALVPSLLPP